VRGALVSRLRARSHRRDDSGAAAVEFALVVSLLIILVFGIIEFSLLMRDNIGVSSAVRTAARSASAEAGAGACKPSTPTCPTALPNAAQDAANAVQRAGLSIPKDSIDELWVFKANAAGFPGSATSMDTASCSSNCIKFRWVDANDRFTYVSGSWDSKTIAACVGTNADGTAKADAVGVYMKATHKFLMPFFGSTIGMQDRAVMQFEPLANFQCKSGTHP
jgi:Flp pilus assembly pilin Flp